MQTQFEIGHDTEVFVGVDVGKGAHHAVALTRDGRVLLDRALPNDEQQLRELVAELARRGRVLFVVDQPATVGALAIAVARAVGVDVAYLPGLAMRRIADLHPGEAKTDAKDAAVIATAARSMPHALRALELGGPADAELAGLSGFDDDLAGQVNRAANRIRGLLTQIHPALERVLGPNVTHPAVIDLLIHYPTPAHLQRAGCSRITARLIKSAPRMGRRLAQEITTALRQQSVVIPGTKAAEVVLPRLAQQLDLLLVQRKEVLARVEELVDQHPLAPVLTSMPGVGVRTAARLITETSGRHFATAGHLASYAGIAPVSRRSGTSIRGEHRSRRGNRKLKRVLYLSAFSALKDPTSRAYYDRKRAQGKSYNQALLALARRRCDVLFAMLRDHSTYAPEYSLAG